MNASLEQGFEGDENELEVTKYGKQQKEKKEHNIMLIVSVILNILFLIVAIRFFYLFNVSESQNKSLKNKILQNKERAEKELKELSKNIKIQKKKIMN